MPSLNTWPTTTPLASKPFMPALVVPFILEVCRLVSIRHFVYFKLVNFALLYLDTETLVTSMWKVDESGTHETIHFITKVKERDAVVIKDGTVTLSKANAIAKL